MPKKQQTEERLELVSRLADAPDSPETRIQLKKYLADKNNLIVASTVAIVSRFPGIEFMPDLVAAFRRFMSDPAKSDKGCVAKIAVVKALLAAEDCDEEELFLQGVRHVQLEPGWGGPADTAAPLRAMSGLGLVQMGSAHAALELAMLLADKVADARIGAAHALANCGATGEALLRFKVLAGDEETSVTAECFNGLMKLSPRGSFDFVCQFVDPEQPALYEHAALAVAESRLPEAFALLRDKWSSTFDREFKRALLLPIALTRSEPALDFLISILETGDNRMALEALSALAIYRDDASVRKRVEAALEDADSSQLRKAFDQIFESRA